MGCSLPGLSHLSLWVSGRYPSSRDRSGYSGTVMPSTAKGALHLSRMGDGSMSCVQGLLALAMHLHM